MDCELNKPLCKRKAAMERGAFKRKEPCIVTKPIRCPVEKPQCPLLPPSKNDCPISRLLGGKRGGVKCPVAETGCPCDPNPPCPLDYDTDDEAVEKMNEFINNAIAESKAKRKRKKKIRSSTMENERLINVTLDFGEKHGSSSESSSSSLSSSESGDIICEKALIEGHLKKSTVQKTAQKRFNSYKIPAHGKCIIESSESSGSSSSSESGDIICEEAIIEGCRKEPNIEKYAPKIWKPSKPDILECPNKQKNTIGRKDVQCKFLKFENLCDNICLCDELEPINTGPVCPFVPKPCSCCTPPKCPLIKHPVCPIACQPCPPKPCCCCPPKCILNPPKCRCLPSNCPYLDNAPPCSCSCPPPPKCPLRPPSPPRPCPPRPPCAPKPPCAPPSCPPPTCSSKCPC